jgi:hypothetical protein
MGRFFNEASDVPVWFLFRTYEERKWVGDYVRLNPLRFGEDATCQEVKCRRCGKVLKSPESVAAGIGPVCLARELLEAATGVNPKGRPGKGGVFVDPRQIPLFPVEEVEVQR